LNNIAKPSGYSIEQVCNIYDSHYGRPSSVVLKKFQAHVKDILNIKIWPDYFKMINLSCPTQLYLSDWLRQSVKNSLRRKYHNANTVFSNIHKSGTSQVLKKGDQYMCSSGLSQISMGLGWIFPDSTLFLDATCMGIDNTGKEVFFVDYCHKSSGDYITHSGDVMDHQQKSGEHTIKINLTKIPPNVYSVFFIITGYTTTIDKVKSPWVRLTDDKDKSELCRYTLEQAGAYRAVLMSRLYRESTNGTWKVVAIGQLGDGSVNNYAPLRKSISDYLSKQKKV